MFTAPHLPHPSRKGHFAHYLSSVHVKGIGGPGAPHVFRLERIKDSGETCFLSIVTSPQHHFENGLMQETGLTPPITILTRSESQ